MFGISAVRVLEDTAKTIRRWAREQDVNLNEIGIESDNIIRILENKLEEGAKRDYNDFCDQDCCAGSFVILYSKPILRLVE
jgi:hypothetical protein